VRSSRQWHLEQTASPRCSSSLSSLLFAHTHRYLLEEGKLNLTIRLLVDFKDNQRNEMFAQVFLHPHLFPLIRHTKTHASADVCRHPQTHIHTFTSTHKSTLTSTCAKTGEKREKIDLQLCCGLNLCEHLCLGVCGGTPFGVSPCPLVANLRNVTYELRHRMGLGHRVVVIGG